MGGMELGRLVLVLAVLGACTAPPPTPEELVVEESEPRAHSEVVSIPAAKPRPPAPKPAAPAPPAEIIALPAGRPALFFHDRCDPADEMDECLPGIGECRFAVTSEGFPAISLDGTQVVAYEQTSSSGADMDMGTYEVVWRSTEDDRELRRVRLADGSAVGRSSEWGEDAKACAEEAEAVGHAVASVEAELRDGWRSLPPLAVEVPLDENRRMMMSEEELAAWQAPRAPAARPVEALYRSGFFYLRVKGIEVLLEETHTDWLGDPPEMTLNSFTPNIRALWGDATAGVAVVAMDYESGSCMSSTDAVYHVVRPSPEAFAEIEARAANVRVDEGPRPTDEP